MQDYGLVSIGSHTGAWLKKDLENFKNKQNILVEPVPYNIEELKTNISNYKNIIIETSAISNKDETIPFYYIKRDSIDKLKKHWASGIGSFNKNHLMSHKSKRFQISDEDIEEININCLSFASLVKKYSIGSIDKLMMDVEGAEFKILNSLNLSAIKIKEIFFEKKHFDGYLKQGKKFQIIKDKLEANNYILKDIDKENISASLKKFTK